MKLRAFRLGLLCLGMALALHACGGSSPSSPEPIPVPTPVPTPNLPVILAAGDVSCDSVTPEMPCRSKETSDVMMSLRALHSAIVVLPLGDLQYDAGTLPEYRKNYATTWGRLNANSHPVPGNHEYLTSRAGGYFDYFLGDGVAVGTRDEGWYQFTVGEWHFVALNSNCGSAGGCGTGSAQYRFLAADLAANNKKCTVAYMHHPFLSSGPNGGSPDLLPIMRLLYANNVDIVLAGHDHDYERFDPITPDDVADPKQGIHFFVVGTGGRNLTNFPGKPLAHTALRSDQDFGVLKIIMKDGAYEWAFTNTANRIVDTGTGVCF